MENKLILQSYKFTTIRNEFGLYAQRMIVNIASQMQYRLEGVKMIDPTTWNTKPCIREFEVNVKDLITEGDCRNKQYVKECVLKAMDAKIQYDSETESGKKKWTSIVFFEKVEWEENSSKLKVLLTSSIWDVFVEFSKGFRKYELEYAMKLKSGYSLRLYQMISEVTIPMDYSIEELRKMFGIPDTKYSRNANFIQRVIEPTKKELDEKAPYTFTYRPIYKTTTTKGRPTIEKIRFYPKRNRKIHSGLEDSEMMKKYASGMLSKDIKELLMTKYQFTETELKNNMELLVKAEDKFFSFYEWINEKAPTALRKKNPKGYLIQAIKLELETEDLL